MFEQGTHRVLEAALLPIEERPLLNGIHMESLVERPCLFLTQSPGADKGRRGPINPREDTVERPHVNTSAAQRRHVSTRTTDDTYGSRNSYALHGGNAEGKMLIWKGSDIIAHTDKNARTCLW